MLSLLGVWIECFCIEAQWSYVLLLVGRFSEYHSLATIHRKGLLLGGNISRFDFAVVDESVTRLISVISSVLGILRTLDSNHIHMPYYPCVP